MNQIARRPMSLDEFLAWERQQDKKYEFDGVGPVAMTGGTLGHRRIAYSLTVALNAALAAGTCEALDGDVKIIVADRVRYPDVVVTCTPAADREDIVPEPIVVVEVTSPSTARTDRQQKVDEYRRTPSIQHYLILEQDHVGGVLFTRDGLEWREQSIAGAATILFASLNVEIPLSEVYRTVAPLA